MNAKSVSIYLVDSVLKGIEVCASTESVLTGLLVPLGEGIAGTVASIGQSFRDCDANRPYEKQYLAGVLVESGTVQSMMKTHKSMLVVPVFGMTNKGLPSAVIQAIEKQDETNFDEFDEESLVMLAAELSLVLKSRSIEMQELQMQLTAKGSMGVDDPALRLSFLREYGLGYFVRSNAERMAFDTRNNTSQRLLAVHGNGLRESSRRTSLLSLSEVDGFLSDHNADPFQLDEVQMIYLAGKMLESYGLIEKFNIKLDDLKSFLTQVCDKYHNTNAFHNIKHAWGTLHLTFQILRHGSDEKLLPVEIFALLIGAICHDIDHPGNNNAFEVAARTDRALIYADDTVLERHHIATALQLLVTTDHKCLGDMGKEDLEIFRKTMITCIMATDMSRHFQQVEYLNQWVHSQAFLANRAERLKLAGVILHCADIGAQTQNAIVSLKWSHAVLDEFRAQAAKEKALGIPGTPFMQGLDDELVCMQLQQGFVTNIVIPLWTLLAQVFPELEYAAAQAACNRQYFAGRSATLSTEKSRAPSPISPPSNAGSRST